MKAFLSGNEAIARGAYEYGAKFAAGYPGTPSTEILENMIMYSEIDAQWSTNEKVALDIAIGASMAGARALVAMKHVGLNVASDAFMVLAYSGVNGGLVIVSADDPGMHSSQNEQDNRYFAKFGKVPLIEPTDSQEAKDFVGIAFEMSEKFSTPVLLRTSTRISHGKCVVELGERRTTPEIKYQQDRRFVVPIFAKLLRPEVEKRLAALSEFSEKFEYNRVEEGSDSFGIISSGVSYQYAREVFPDATFLKLGMSYPFPKKLVTDFCKRFKKVLVIEEGEPFIEEQLRFLGIKNIVGKEKITNMGELSPELIGMSLKSEEPPKSFDNEFPYPPRPPRLCPGCPHMGIYYVLWRLRLNVSGDIGCYTLGALPPLSAMHACFCMGTSVGSAFGFEKALGKDEAKKTVAIIGDSTFMHAGIPALIDILYNGGNTTVVICDNSTTGMTGHQEHPGTGKTLKGKEAHKLDLYALARAIGVQDVRKVDPWDLKTTESALKEAIAREGPSVLIMERPCVLLKDVRPTLVERYRVVEDDCPNCLVCYRLGCPSILHGDKPRIDLETCVGCGLCAQICKPGAIVLV